MLSNAHCHPQFLDKEMMRATLSSWKGCPVLVSSTHIDDIQMLIELRSKYPHVLPTIGWHPWYIAEHTTHAEIESIMNQVQRILGTHDIPIGEVGLDWHPKWKATRQLQLDIFERFLICAADFNRPVVAHCVRAHHEILRLLKKYPNTKLYLHHYQGNSAVSAQYFRYNTYFGLPIMQWSNRTNQVILDMPEDRLLIETDSCVSSKVVSAQVCNHNISEVFLRRCRSNLFQFIQGTSGDFSQQFEFCM